MFNRLGFKPKRLQMSKHKTQNTKLGHAIGERSLIFCCKNCTNLYNKYISPTPIFKTFPGLCMWEVVAVSIGTLT